MDKKNEEERRLTSLLKEVGERAGLSLEEMKRRYSDFLSQIAKQSITDKELERRTDEFVAYLLKGKKKTVRSYLKVTVSLNEEEAKVFYRIKAHLGAKSNASVFRRLLSDAKTKNKNGSS